MSDRVDLRDPPSPKTIQFSSKLYKSNVFIKLIWPVTAAKHILISLLATSIVTEQNLKTLKIGAKVGCLLSFYGNFNFIYKQ